MNGIEEKGSVLVLGASTNPSRYSNKAIKSLRNRGYNVVAVGRTEGLVDDVKIITGTPVLEHIDTLTLYLNPEVQLLFRAYIISLAPRRIIFNPGTEHQALEHELDDLGIDVVRACTLVMLSTGSF